MRGARKDLGMESALIGGGVYYFGSHRADASTKRKRALTLRNMTVYASINPVYVGPSGVRVCPSEHGLNGANGTILRRTAMGARAA
jgi:hypothetical protein